MTQQPPRRLVDDPSVAAHLRGDLATARAHRTSYDPDQGLATLQSTLAAVDLGRPLDFDASTESSLPPSQGAPWSESLRAIAARWWGWTATGVASVGAVWWIQHAPLQPVARSVSDTSSRQIEAGAQVSSPQPSPNRPGAALAAPLDTTAVGTAPRERAASAQLGSRARVTRPRSAAVPARTKSVAITSAATAEQAEPQAEHEAAPAEESAAATRQTGGSRSSPARAHQTRMAEVEHLAHVRRLLATDPHAALVAARGGQEQFGAGLLVEERAGLIVFALDALKRNAEAVREGRRFLRVYPEAPFAARVRAIVARIESPTR